MILLGIFLILRLRIFISNNKNRKINEHRPKFENKIIKENFFIIDSNNLDKVCSHIYGFVISKKGILTDNYYKEIGQYEDPEPQGIYIMIRKKGNEIKINQDFYGSCGLYFYENKNTQYFALSNSFLLLEEYLMGNQNLTFNQNFADNLIIEGLCSSSIYETMINEIILLPPNAFLTINIEEKKLNIFYIDYKENSIPFDTKEGINIIDKWVDKWGYIIRSLKKQTDNISCDLSGGFDSRATLSILLNSGIDLNKILINSANDSLSCHEEDFQIAHNISEKFGFKLNDAKLDKNSTKWSALDILYNSFYTKLGFHKEFYLKYKFFLKPRFSVSGGGGELIRGYPGYPIQEYIKKLSSQSRRIKEYEKKFYNSSFNLLNRQVDLLKKNTYNNDLEISTDFYSKGRVRNHFGKGALENFIANIYVLQPMIDPEIKKLKYINEESTHDLIAYIYVRFSHDLIYFPFEGKRKLNIKSIKKAEKLNKQLPPYKRKDNYNENFYIDIKRKSPVIKIKNEANPTDYLLQIFNSSKYVKSFIKLYNISIYSWAIEKSKRNNFFPLKHIYGLFAISKIIDDLVHSNKSNLKIKQII